jgi:xylulokinase
MSKFLGIDYGTGGAKGCIIDLEGSVLGYYFEEYPIITLKPDWSEHDPKLYWEIACRIIKECIKQAKINPSDIKGIATSSALPSMVMIDRDGNPINNAYNLMDRRAKKEVEWVRNNIGEEEVFKVTANRLDDHHTAVNLLWEKNNRPQYFKKIYKVMTINAYINYKLTGRITEGHQNSCFSGAYNIVKKEYDTDLIEKMGLNPDLFPELCYARDIIGDVTSEAAEQTGLVSGIPVSSGQVDFTASCIASGVTSPGDIQANLGTCGNFGVVHKDTDFIYEMITWVFTVGEKDTYLTCATTTTGGMLLRFIRDVFSRLEVAAEDSFGISSYQLLDSQAEKSPPGSDGLIFLPYLTGERTPIWDSYAKGVVFGLSLNHNKSHFIRSAMEGVAYAMYDSLEYFKKKNIKINFPLIMHEGGAKSDIWRQIVTDVFNVSTVLTERKTGAPFGDAILAGVATGYLKDFSICKKWAKYIDKLEPGKENNRIYMEYFSLYKKIYEHIKQDYRELSRLRELD